MLVKEVLTSYIKLFSKCFVNLGSAECFDTDFKMSSQVVKFYIYIYSFSKEQYLLQKCKAKVGKMFFIYAIKMKGELLSRKLRGL